jgi:hypothetical protein
LTKALLILGKVESRLAVDEGGDGLSFELWSIWLFLFEGMGSPFQGEIFFFSFPQFEKDNHPTEARVERETHRDGEMAAIDTERGSESETERERERETERDRERERQRERETERERDRERHTERERDR